MGYDIIAQAIRDKGISHVRAIIYGDKGTNEVEAMRLFIESRQDWCKVKLYKEISE